MEHVASNLSSARAYSPVLSTLRESQRAPDAFDNLVDTQTQIQKHINTWA